MGLGCVPYLPKVSLHINSQLYLFPLPPPSHLFFLFSLFGRFGCILAKDKISRDMLIPFSSLPYLFFFLL